MADFRPDIDPIHVRPSMGTYNSPTTFRFWCQKVLPLVYDNSLSYYELLCKVVDYLNKTMEDVNTAVEDVTNLNNAFGSLENHVNASEAALLQAYTDLQNFVNNYFDSLDFQQAVSDKLDEMASDGTLDALILPHFNEYVESTDEEIQEITQNMEEFVLNYVAEARGAIRDATAEMQDTLNDAIDAQDDVLATQNQRISTVESEFDQLIALQTAGTMQGAKITTFVANNAVEYTLTTGSQSFSFVDYAGHITTTPAMSTLDGLVDPVLVAFGAYVLDNNTDSPTGEPLYVDLTNEVRFYPTGGYLGSAADKRALRIDVPVYLNDVVGNLTGKYLLFTFSTLSTVPTDLSEITDARVGADGVTYQTLGSAIRTQISNITNDTGTYKYSQTRTARLMDVPTSVSSGDVVYFKPTRWTGDSYTNIDLYGVNGDTMTRIGRVTSVGDEQFITLTASYSSLRVTVNTPAAPTTQQTLEAIVSVFSDLTTLSDYVFKNKKDILDSTLSKGYYPSNQPLLANSETTGAWLLVSGRLAQLTDAPSGLSGDYILNVVRFGNGWFQELVSIADASEHHVRFVSSSTRTGAWKTFKYTTAFTSKGYITDTALTNKNSLGSWLLVSAYISGLTDAPNGLSGDYLLNVYPFGNGYAQELISLLRPAEKHIRYVMNSTGTGAWHSIYDEQIKIATFGDSITRGQIGGTSPTQYTDSGFVRAGKLKGYEVTNYGIGGIGYSYTIDSHNALYEITNASLSNIDIVTLSFGVNDWQNNIPVGTVNDNTISTMCGGMNLAIQKVIEKNPTATIIVFSPLNCTFRGGSASSKWALGQSLTTSGTLQNVFDAMKAVCDKYEIAFVDLTHGNPAVNCLNANNTGVLGDGLHPTLNTYKHLGRIIANYI